MKLFVYYRISDKGNPKEKIPNGGKFSCFRNAVKEFGAESLHIIADNCAPETIDFINNFGGGVTLEETSLGNSASFMYMIDRIIKTHKSEDAVYLLEDDYLHKPDAKKVILEGLEIADYVTLYDHPDKYLPDPGGGNPFNYKKLQKTRLYVTESTHWRECNSTTMTFATSVKNLSEDYRIWKKHTRGNIPMDFYAFCEITGQNNIADLFAFFFRRKKSLFLTVLGNMLGRRKQKKLISSVPAYSTHTETAWLSPIVEWAEIEGFYEKK